MYRIEKKIQNCFIGLIPILKSFTGEERKKKENNISGKGDKTGEGKTGGGEF